MFCFTLTLFDVGGLKDIIWNYKITINPWIHLQACEEGQGICAHLMVIGSILLILVTLPFSLLFVVKVVQEYERAVMFRLGLLLSGNHQWFIICYFLTWAENRVKFNEKAEMILNSALVKKVVRPNREEINRQSLSTWHIHYAYSPQLILPFNDF